MIMREVIFGLMEFYILKIYKLNNNLRLQQEQYLINTIIPYFTLDRGNFH